MRRGKWVRRLGWMVALGLLAIGLWLTRTAWLPPIGRFLNDGDPARKVDAAYVLGGGVDTRPFVAAALVNAGFTDRVLLPTVRPHSEDADLGIASNQEVMRRVLIAKGVHPAKIAVLPGDCDSTDQEAQSLAKFLDANPGMVIAVVTNDFHTRRARLLFRRHLGERMSRVIVVAAPTDGFTPDTWWQNERGFEMYLTEYSKLLTTWMR